jgi:predicted metal-dependent peptidase
MPVSTTQPRNPSIQSETSTLTPSELKAFEFRISKAKTQLVLHHGFWAVILSRRELIFTYDIPTLCINRRSQIKLNPKWCSQWTVDQLMWALCHEVGHEMFDHLNRRGNRQAGRWNIAGDAVINDFLSVCKIGTPIPGTVNMPGSQGKTTDRVYNELPDSPDGPGGTGDDIDDSDPCSAEEIAESQARIQREIAQAGQVAKMAGKLTGALEEMISNILAVKTPWYDILERYMTGFVQSNSTWARPNRRYDSRVTYFPSTGRKQTMGTIVEQVDVSGSVSTQEMAYYNGHVARIFEQCAPEKVHVIYTDTQVKRHVEFESEEEVKLEFMRGGGTHMPAGFDWVAEQGIEPDVFICLTDGYTDFGEDPGFPVIWVISSKVVAPWGITIHFEMEE